MGGRLAQARLAKAQKRQEFATIRSPQGAAKVALHHLQVFAAIWRIWSAKRAAGEDPGVTIAETVKACKGTTSSITAIVRTLLRSNILRSVRTQVGWAGVRAKYYPTELGIELLALAETFGPGWSIQVGRTGSAWKSKNRDEPANLFRHAALLRGQAY